MKPEFGQIILTQFEDGEIALQGPTKHFVCNGEEGMGIATIGEPFVAHPAVACGAACDVTPVPIPAAGWLFATLLAVMIGAIRRERS